MADFPHPEADQRPREPGFAVRLSRRLLRVPLFYKILVANAGIIVVFSLLGIWLVSRIGDPELVGPLLAVAVAGAVVSVAVNALIIQVALEPLRRLKRTVDRVQEGYMDARVPESALADREMERLTAATNGMLDGLEAYRGRLREVAARALNAAEEERRRISLELHDDTSQRLAAALLRLRVARGLVERDVMDAALESVREELADAADGLRRYAHGLRPPALDELGLGAAIESHVRHISETTSITVEATAKGVGRLESPEAELAVYRIVQEAITNAIRHSRSHRIQVTVEGSEGLVVATIEDDGVGFDPEALLNHSDNDHGLGLFGMRERADYVGGRVDVVSRPGWGTSVRAVVPTRGVEPPLPAADGPDSR